MELDLCVTDLLVLLELLGVFADVVVGGAVIGFDGQKWLLVLLGVFGYNEVFFEVQFVC
jgi:hypothetical protein